MNAAAVDAAGLEMLNMLPTRNIKPKVLILKIHGSMGHGQWI